MAKSSRRKRARVKEHIARKNLLKLERLGLLDETSDGYATSKIFKEKVGRKRIAYVRKIKKKRESELWEDNKKTGPEILVIPPGSGKKRK